LLSVIIFEFGYLSGVVARDRFLHGIEWGRN
jgi:hypothetical protein